jgi:ribulose-phosphate 3-epimerase
MLKIAPSILSADFSNLAEEIKQIEKAGANMIHIDVMDGLFVPNITIGPCVIKSIRKHTMLPFDVHLMVQNPEHLFASFVSAGSDVITFHYEAVDNVGASLDKLDELGVKKGISIMPGTSIEVLEAYLDRIDLILMMTVMPGFGGQKFMEDQLPQISAIKNMVGTRDIIISVDGGINKDTAPLAKNAGGNMLVSGSYIFGSEDYRDAIESLRV